jgi:hypothetical protein
MIGFCLLTLSITFAMGSYISTIIAELLFLVTIVVALAAAFCVFLIVVFVIQATWDWAEFLVEFMLFRQNVVM